MPTFHVPMPGDRPDVLVDVNGAWLPGELRMWVQADDRVMVGAGPVAA